MEEGNSAFNMSQAFSCRILTSCVLTHLQLKHRRINDFCSVALEAGDDRIENSLANGHLLGAVVPCALGEIKKSKGHVGLEARRGDRCERQGDEVIILLTKPERSGPDSRYLERW